MSILRKSILAFVAGIAFLVFTPWLRHPAPQMDVLIMPNQLNAVVKNMHWVEFNEDGHITQEFFSPQVENLPNKKGYHIAHPFLKLQQNQDYWEIKSVYANALQTIDTIELRKKVEIKHFKHPKQEASTIHTEALNYYPKQKRAHTKDLVTILFKDSTIKSQGLEALFENEIKMSLAKVSGNVLTEGHNLP
jgi:LPS export ABC transporter protein LptC